MDTLLVRFTNKKERELLEQYAGGHMRVDQEGELNQLCTQAVAGAAARARPANKLCAMPAASAWTVQQLGHS